MPTKKEKTDQFPRGNPWFCYALFISTYYNHWKLSKLVGGLEHLDYFPFHIWDNPNPIDEVIFFRMVLAPPTVYRDIDFLWDNHDISN